MKKIVFVFAAMAGIAVLFAGCKKKHSSAPSISGIIFTVAGDGYEGHNGDGGTATIAELALPTGVAVDDASNIYIADAGNSRIRKVNGGTDNAINTFAGNGSFGYSGDGGAAIYATLNNPMGVAADKAGNIYIADAGNNVVRMVNASGRISTFAGNGTAGYSGDGGQAIAAMLSWPAGVAVDGAGNVYIAEQYNNRVRKVNTSGIISTIAGTGYGAGTGITATGSYSGDGGPATAADLYGPTGVAVDGAGNVYIADQFNDCIRKVSAAGIISTLAGIDTAGYSGDGGQANNAMLFQPTGVAVDASGNVYIADEFNQRIRKVSTSGIITTLAGNGTGAGSSVGSYSGNNGPATAAGLNLPAGVAVDASGNVYIADMNNQRVREVGK